MFALTLLLGMFVPVEEIPVTPKPVDAPEVIIVDGKAVPLVITQPMAVVVPPARVSVSRSNAEVFWEDLKKELTLDYEQVSAWWMQKPLANRYEYGIAVETGFGFLLLFLLWRSKRAWKQLAYERVAAIRTEQNRAGYLQANLEVLQAKENRPEQPTAEDRACMATLARLSDQAIKTVDGLREVQKAHTLAMTTMFQEQTKHTANLIDKMFEHSNSKELVEKLIDLMDNQNERAMDKIGEIVTELATEDDGEE